MAACLWINGIRADCIACIEILRRRLINMKSSSQQCKTGKRASCCRDARNTPCSEHGRGARLPVSAEPISELSIQERGSLKRHIWLIKSAKLLGLPFLLYLICRVVFCTLIPSPPSSTSPLQVLLLIPLTLALYAPLAYLLLLGTSFVQACLSSELERDDLARAAAGQF
jgi:hypothetical protein